MPFFLLAIKQKKRHCPSSCCKNALKLSRISHEKTKRLRIDVGISSSACKAKYFKNSNSCTVQRRNCPILDQILQKFFSLHLHQTGEERRSTIFSKDVHSVIKYILYYVSRWVKLACNQTGWNLCLTMLYFINWQNLGIRWVRWHTF